MIFSYCFQRFCFTFNALAIKIPSKHFNPVFDKSIFTNVLFCWIPFDSLEILSKLSEQCRKDMANINYFSFKPVIWYNSNALGFDGCNNWTSEVNALKEKEEFLKLREWVLFWVVPLLYGWEEWQNTKIEEKIVSEVLSVSEMPRCMRRSCVFRDDIKPLADA